MPNDPETTGWRQWVRALAVFVAAYIAMGVLDVVESPEAIIRHELVEQEA